MQSPRLASLPLREQWLAPADEVAFSESPEQAVLWGRGKQAQHGWKGRLGTHGSGKQ